MDDNSAAITTAADYSGRLYDSSAASGIVSDTSRSIDVNSAALSVSAYEGVFKPLQSVE